MPIHAINLHLEVKETGVQPGMAAQSLRYSLSNALRSHVSWNVERPSPRPYNLDGRPEVVALHRRTQRAH